MLILRGRARGLHRRLLISFALRSCGARSLRALPWCPWLGCSDDPVGEQRGSGLDSRPTPRDLAPIFSRGFGSHGGYRSLAGPGLVTWSCFFLGERAFRPGKGRRRVLRRLASRRVPHVHLVSSLFACSLCVRLHEIFVGAIGLYEQIMDDRRWLPACGLHGSSLPRIRATVILCSISGRFASS
jgi:hypothetical protein